MLLLLLRWFGVLLAMASMLMLVSSLSQGRIIDDSRSRPTLGYGEVGEVKINWPVALPIGLGISAGITCMVVAIRLEEQRSRSQRNRCQAVEKGITESAQ
jgi:hypothetical protein